MGPNTTQVEDVETVGTVDLRQFSSTATPPSIAIETCSTAAIVGPISGPTPPNLPTLITTVDELAANFGADTHHIPNLTYETARTFLEAGGQELFVVRTGSTVADVIGDPHVFSGMWSLLDYDIDLLMVPITFGATPDAADPIVRNALDLVERLDAVYHLDPPGTLGIDPADLADWLPVHPRAMAHLPCLKRRDPNTGAELALPASGVVAAAFVRAETEAGVWKSPTGTAARLKLGEWQLVQELTGSERTDLRRIGVNVCRDALNPTIWGARTLMARGAVTPDEKYVTVRRTASMLKRSIEEGIDWALAEPNDSFLWDRLTLQVSSFMENLRMRGAFVPGTPEDTWFVHCTESTMRVPAGTTPMFTVGFAPLNPREFVVVPISFPSARWRSFERV